MPKTYYLFSHGIADTEKQVLHYVKSPDPEQEENDRYIIDGPFESFNYPDATTRFWRINFWNTSFGQENEIAALKYAYIKLYQKIRKTDHQIVLTGLSRGASTIINFLGQYNTQNVKAVILESPFDSMDSVVTHIVTRLGLSRVPGIKKIACVLLNLIFFKHKRTGIQPKDMVSSICKDLPILIICSRQDQLVPYWSSAKLYKQLKKSGHKQAHLLVLDRGKHSKILQQEDGYIYQCVTHAFYKKYGLSHHHFLASLGESRLKST